MTYIAGDQHKKQTPATMALEKAEDVATLVKDEIVGPQADWSQHKLERTFLLVTNVALSLMGFAIIILSLVTYVRVEVGASFLMLMLYVGLAMFGVGITAVLGVAKYNNIMVLYMLFAVFLACLVPIIGIYVALNVDTIEAELHGAVAEGWSKGDLSTMPDYLSELIGEEVEGSDVCYDGDAVSETLTDECWTFIWTTYGFGAESVLIPAIVCVAAGLFLILQAYAAYRVVGLRDLIKRVYMAVSVIVILSGLGCIILGVLIQGKYQALINDIDYTGGDITELEDLGQASVNSIMLICIFIGVLFLAWGIIGYLAYQKESRIMQLILLVVVGLIDLLLLVLTLISFFGSGAIEEKMLECTQCASAYNNATDIFVSGFDDAATDYEFPAWEGVAASTQVAIAGVGFVMLGGFLFVSLYLGGMVYVFRTDSELGE